MMNLDYTVKELIKQFGKEKVLSSVSKYLAEQKTKQIIGILTDLPDEPHLRMEGYTTYNEFLMEHLDRPDYKLIMSYGGVNECLKIIEDKGIYYFQKLISNFLKSEDEDVREKVS